MNLINKNILIVSPERWGHIFVSKHHYAVQLAKRGNKVYFLNPPGKKNDVMVTRTHGVFEVNYVGFPSGVRFYPAALQRHLFRKVFGALEKLCSTQFDVVWSFDNSVFFDFTAFPSRVLKFSHIVDLNQNFQARKAASTADFCFCSSEPIREALSRYNNSVHKISHGFQMPATINTSPEGNGRSRAVYAGNLSIPYLDWPLLLEVVQQHPDVDFVFAGPNSDVIDHSVCGLAKKKVSESANTVFVGSLATEALAGLYRSADVLLIAYQADRYPEQVANPHKMMEYLGSGKVVVATHTAEYKNLYPLVVMSETNNYWPQLFNEVITNLVVHNAEARQQERKQYALKNSYDEQIRKIEKIISSYNKIESVSR